MKPLREWPIAARWRSRRLAGYAMALLLAVAAVQVVASLIFYAAIDRESIGQDHARRVAELLIVSDRLYQRAPAQTARIMTTAHLDATIGAHPVIRASGTADAAVTIRNHILAWEEALSRRPLYLDIRPGRAHHKDLVGSMQLTDGRWLNFRSPDISAGWPIALRATVLTLLITLICLGGGVLLLRRLTGPLTQLSEAADALSHGTAIAVEESGTAELRNLARSFNSLQSRIAGMASEQTRSFEAISHDLRTPLSRLIVASSFVHEDEVARIVSSSAAEIETMLGSLEAFLRAQHVDAAPEPLDLAAVIHEILTAFDVPVTVDGPRSAVVATYREPLILSLRALVQNAVQYGTTVAVALRGSASGWEIVVEDDGPGIPEEHFDHILDPFFRLDSARARNTAGFGLGIPMAHRLLQRFGGGVAFANRDEGGLRVVVTVPLTPAAADGGGLTAGP